MGPCSPCVLGHAANFTLWTCEVWSRYEWRSSFLWFGGLLLPVLNNVCWSQKNYLQSRQKQNGLQVNSSNQFVVSCVLFIDWRRRCQKVCSPLVACHLVAYDMNIWYIGCLSEFLCPVGGAMDMTQYWCMEVFRATLYTWLMNLVWMGNCV